MINIVTAIGFFGAFFLLTAFVMSEMGRWKPRTLSYGLTNMIGGMLLVAYAVLISDIPFVIVNTTWTVFSVRDVATGIEKFINKKRGHSSKDKT